MRLKIHSLVFSEKCVILTIFRQVKLKKVVSSVDIDHSSASSSYYGSKDESASPPINVSSPAQCLDRLTEKLSTSMLPETTSTCDTVNTAAKSDDSPRLSLVNIEEKISKESEEKTEGLEVFHDASESINQNDNENTEPKIIAASPKAVTDTELAESTKEDDLTSTEVKRDDKNKSCPGATFDKNDDTEESFTEKANEEVMEKDLADGKEDKK